MKIREDGGSAVRLKEDESSVPKIGVNQMVTRASIPIMSTKQFLESANLDKFDTCQKQPISPMDRSSDKKGKLLLFHMVPVFFLTRDSTS